MSLESRLNALEGHTGSVDEPLAIRVIRVDGYGNERLDRTIYCDPIRGGVIRVERGNAT
jgi:hypothetical protein